MHILDTGCELVKHSAERKTDVEFAAAIEFWKRARAYMHQWTRDEYNILQIRECRPSMHGHVPRDWIYLYVIINSKSCSSKTYRNREYYNNTNTRNRPKECPRLKTAQQGCYYVGNGEGDRET